MLLTDPPPTSSTNFSNFGFKDIHIYFCDRWDVTREWWHMIGDKGKITFWGLVGWHWDKVGLIPPHIRCYPPSHPLRPAHPPAVLFDIPIQGYLSYIAKVIKVNINSNQYWIPLVHFYSLLRQKCASQFGCFIRSPSKLKRLY